MNKSYDPKSFEEDIYAREEAAGYFTADAASEKPPFTIVLPPPNITGQLHMGHALDQTFQDAIIRYKRMKGFETLWLPGVDHASIATEVKIVEQMRKEGLTKADIGRAEFLRRAYAWKDKYGGRIVEQMKKLGVSCDWTREAFTMDERCSRAVRTVFVRLYDKGLIYRGDRIINWCPCCKCHIGRRSGVRGGAVVPLAHPVYDRGRQGSPSSSPPRGRRPCWAIRPWPCTPKTDGMRNLVGKNVVLPLTGGSFPWWPTSTWTSRSAPARSRSRRRTIPTISKWDSGTICR